MFVKALVLIIFYLYLKGIICTICKELSYSFFNIVQIKNFKAY